MKYELAKRLKEAGFVWEEMDQFTLSRSETFPTTDELVAATGTRYMFRENETWTVSYRHMRATGNALDEALANLYILRARYEKSRDDLSDLSDAPLKRI